LQEKNPPHARVLALLPVLVAQICHCSAAGGSPTHPAGCHRTRLLLTLSGPHGVAAAAAALKALA